jgi:hypothetical protein
MISAAVHSDQSPINGKSSLNSEERELPASTKEAKLTGFKRRRFIRDCIKK